MSRDPVNDLDLNALREIVRNVRVVLWFDHGTQRWDANKEWDVETTEAAASALTQAGLCPPEGDAIVTAVPR